MWNRCVEFHGHKCPGLAIGYKAALAAMDKLDINYSKDEELVCVTENDACGVDAIQYISGCTFGKGNLIFRDIGKNAYSFYNRDNDESIRLVLKTIDKDMTREEKMKYILESEYEKLFRFKETTYELPEKARLFDTIICETCGEGTAEHRVRLEKGKKLCLDCVNEYKR